jgi:glycosyltransferase involved in cell wall biosynthesis
MAEPGLFLDLTELLANPLRTGIQRVEREIIQHWPGPAELVPCRFDAEQGRFVTVSSQVLAILSGSTPPGSAELDLLRPHSTALRTLSPQELATGLFNPEVFFDPRRAAAYGEVCRESGARVSWLIFDFLPYLRPQDYPPGTARSCMPYVRAMRNIPRVGFISALTQAQFSTRIMRDPRRTGPYFALGGDALGTDKQTFSPDKRSFACIGTIEPRKNLAVILEAFEQLWASGVDAELVVVGRLDTRSVRESRMLKRLESEPRLKYLGHASDAEVREALRKARATLFLSAAEGFGIPPYESLANGVPVIVSAGLPSTDLLPPGGRITLAEVTPQAIVEAVRTLLDDGLAARLFDEAAQQRIPTWRGFVSDLAAWVQSA